MLSVAIVGRASQLRERLTLRRAIAEAEAIAPTERARVERLLGLGRQRARAAQALWSRGDRAEGLRMALAAFDATRAAGGRAGSAASEHASNGSGAGDEAERETTPRIDAAIAARATLEPPPALDAEVGAAHERLYGVLDAGRRALDADLAPRATTPGVLRRTRALRWVGLSVAVLSVAAALAWAARTPARTLAAASDYDGRRHEHQPYFAFDGDPSTEWWLRDRHAGWVEARIDPPQDIARVTVLPGHGLPGHGPTGVGGDDARSIRDYRVELWRGRERLATDAGTVDAAREDPTPTTHAITAERVDRVRVVVDSWHGRGGAIADVEWD